MVALSIGVTPENIEIIKGALRELLPSVKSSHRVEAMARGLGFNTNAALISALKDGSSITALVNGGPFGAYLLQHGFDGDSRPIYRAVAKAAIVDVLAQYPRLSMHGANLGIFTEGNRYLTQAEVDERIDDARAEMLTSYGIEQFLRALAFVQSVEPTKTFNHRRGSYGIKHIAEKFVSTYPEGQRLGPDYVANGSLIVAALHAGFRMKVFKDEWGRDQINVALNMSQRSLNNAKTTVLAAKRAA